MTIKNSKPETTTATKSVAVPEKKEKAPRKLNVKAHVEALDRLEDLLNSTMSDESKVVVAQFARTIRARLKPYARTTFVVD